MEWSETIRELWSRIAKMRSFWLILLVGVLCMVLPQKQQEPGASATAGPPQPVKASLQDQLGEILCKLDGAGKVQVLLTEAAGQQTIYETRQEKREDTESRELHSETMILEGADRGEYGLVSRVDPPRYLGAVVLCQGADSASVRLAIVDAVSAATGLGADKISVWKMK